MLIGQIPDFHAARAPERIALVHGTQRISYGQLAERARRLANTLTGLGIRPHDTVAILAQNRCEFFDLLFASAQLGIRMVPLNARLSPSELAYALNDCRAHLLMLAAEFGPRIAEVRASLDYTQQFLEFDGVSQQGAKSYEAELARAGPDPASSTAVSPYDCHIILYTSGTTGFPKGAMLSQANLAWSALSVRSQYPCGPGDSCLVVLPLYHTASLNTSALPYLQAGATVVLQSQYDPVLALDLMEREGCGQAMLLPQMWEEIARLDLEARSLRLRYLVCGGGPIGPVETERLNRLSGGRCSLVMGMTEVGPMICNLDPADFLRKRGSIGRPVLAADIRVVDEAFDDVGTGEVGEMVIRGPSVFAGYWNRPDDTARSFTGEWFHGGDCVVRDDQGFLTIVDRKKDMIRSGGENIYSIEVERVLCAHPSVAEAAVVGMPDPAWGESVAAFVRLRPEGVANSADLIEWCRRHLASYKKPRIVRFVDALPRNATGKVLKRQLRSSAEQRN